MTEATFARAPAWIQWLEIGLLCAALYVLGALHFAEITPPERLEIHLEAGLLKLYELEADHLERHGVYFAPTSAQWRAYLPWMDRYPTEARHVGAEAWSAVVHADLDGDGVEGAWRIDQSGARVERVVGD